MCLGDFSSNYARKHLKEYPSHTNFLIKNLVDPLILQNPDFWFKKNRSMLLKLVHQPSLNTDNRDTENLTEPCKQNVNL